MWGGHRLQNNPRNPLQNSSKRVNHLVRIGRGAAWSPWSVNATSHILNCNWEIFSAPRPYPTSISSANKCYWSWSSKMHPASCSLSGLMAPNGKCGRYPEAAAFRIIGEELIQGSAPGLHQLRKPHTFRLIQHFYDDHGTISPMVIEEIQHKIKKEWSLLDPMVDLFEKIEEGLEFSEAANTSIPVVKVVNVAYLLTLRIGGM